MSTTGKVVVGTFKTMKQENKLVGETINIPDLEFFKWIRLAEIEIIQRFKLKLPEGKPNYPSYYFTKKNTNRYFKKHLGFTYGRNIPKLKLHGAIFVHDYKKLMLFRIKHGL